MIDVDKEEMENRLWRPTPEIINCALKYIKEVDPELWTSLRKRELENSGCQDILQPLVHRIVQSNRSLNLIKASDVLWELRKLADNENKISGNGTSL